MNGLDNLLYMTSKSDSAGSASTVLTFAPGTDPDIAQVQVQNKLDRAMPLLPQQVQQLGVQVTKSSDSFLMVMGFISTDGSMDRADIADFIATNIQDPISRVQGVGQTQLFGAPYAMRIWLDASKLNEFSLTPSDVIAAIQEQNHHVASGELGGTPAIPGQQLNATLIAQTQLSTPEEFGIGRASCRERVKIMEGAGSPHTKYE